MNIGPISQNTYSKAATSFKGFNPFRTIKNVFKEQGPDVFEGIKTTVKKEKSKFGEFTSTFFTKIKDAFKSIGTLFKNIFGKIFKKGK